MDAGKQDAAKDRRSAQELRERARRILENASPEQRRKLEQWARELAKEQPRGERSRPAPGDHAGERQDVAGSPQQTDGALAEGEPATPMNSTGSSPGSEPARVGRGVPGESSGGFRTDAVDARPRDAGPASPDAPPARIAGEVAGDGRPGAPLLSRQEAADAVRRASESAERAIDDRSIPGRYDRLLRRYFKRLPEKLGAPQK
jgi:hypothetical protein